MTSFSPQPAEAPDRLPSETGRALEPSAHRALPRALFPGDFSDPWALEAEGWPRVRWHDGASGLRLSAWGSAAAFEADGPARFARARRWCSTIFERWRRDGTGRLPAALAAFAFDERQRSEDASWSAWPRAWIWIPRVIAYDWPGATPARGVIVHGDPRAPWAAEPTPDGWEARWARADDEAARARFLSDVRSIMNAIAERRLDKVVAARRAAMAACPGSRFDAPATAARLQAAHPRAITFAIERQDEAFVGCTPELLARVDGARIESCALAGTAPAQAAQSLSSAKTLHEHRVVLDAVARGLDALCDAVTVDPLSPERAGTVQHLRARLRGRLRQGASLLDAVERLHPTPALGGAPRRDALDWLAAHEGFDRGLYGGPIGWLAPSGEGVMAVAIRSALLGREQALAFAGAGIVAGSEPEAEWRETEDKLATILGALTTKRTTA